MAQNGSAKFVPPAEREGVEMRNHQELTYPTDHEPQPFKVQGFTGDTPVAKKAKCTHRIDYCRSGTYT